MDDVASRTSLWYDACKYMPSIYQDGNELQNNAECVRLNVVPGDPSVMTTKDEPAVTWPLKLEIWRA
jgi:hypothetical protein